MAPKQKLTDAQIAEIKQRRIEDPNISQEVLADLYGVGRTTIALALAASVPGAGEQPPPGILMLSTAEILASSLNPRKTFNDAAIAELAESIAASGLLQNLVVRAAPNGFYQIVNGERRFRAIRYLEERGRWNEKFPCKLIAASDAEHIALALLENIVREDVPPLEEAEAFAQLQALDPKIWTAGEIARKIGKSPRFVQQRLSLVNKLAPEARAALADGRLNIEAARLMTTATPQVQADMIKRRKTDGEIPFQDIQWELARSLFDVDYALFDPAATDLEIIEADGESYFTDKPAAMALQLQAVKAKAAELKKKWAFAKILPKGEYFQEYLYDKKPAKQGGGCYLEIRTDGQVHIHEGFMKKPEKKAEAAQSSADRQTAYEEQQRKADEKRRAETKKRVDRLLTVTRRLDTDLPFSPADEDDEDGTDDPAYLPDTKRCSDGCTFRQMLNQPYAYDGFLVCLNFASPRMGLLTHWHQGGGDCFTKAK